MWEWSVSHQMAGGWVTFLSHRGRCAFQKGRSEKTEGTSQRSWIWNHPLMGNTLVFSHHQKTLATMLHHTLKHPLLSGGLQTQLLKRYISTINHNSTTPRMETESKMSWACLWLSCVSLIQTTPYQKLMEGSFKTCTGTINCTSGTKVKFTWCNSSLIMELSIK